MRGRVYHPQMEAYRSGITPARAGKRRSRGDRSAEREGSPPRVRGRAAGTGWQNPWTGITPARAGKRVTPRLWCRITQDHPRACGEEYSTSRHISVNMGSPPRVRGRGRKRSRHNPGRRITPARAGKSRSVFGAGVCHRDHPRVCGEEASPVSPLGMPRGSPPRMRGRAGTPKTALAP